MVGQSWEGFAVETLVAALRWPSLASFYRTSGGAEIDLVIDFGTGERWAIEVKRSRAPKVSRGFHSACEDVDPARTLVVHAGDDRFPISRSPDQWKEWVFENWRWSFKASRSRRASPRNRELGKRSRKALDTAHSLLNRQECRNKAEIDTESGAHIIARLTSCAKREVSWGHSSAGRAPQWHCGGRRFDPGWLHQAYVSKTSRRFPKPHNGSVGGLHHRDRCQVLQLHE